MGARTIRTLGDLLGGDTLLRVRCWRCKREALFAPKDLYDYFGGARALAALRFICSAHYGGCGSRDIRVEFQTAPPRLNGRQWRGKPRPMNLTAAAVRRLPKSRPLDDGRR